MKFGINRLKLLLLLALVVIVLFVLASCAPVGEGALAGQAVKPKDLQKAVKALKGSSEICGNNIDDNKNGKTDCEEPACAGFIFLNNNNQDVLCAKNEVWVCGTSKSPYGSVVNVGGASGFDTLCYQNGKYSTWAECDADGKPERIGKHGLTLESSNPAIDVVKGNQKASLVCTGGVPKTAGGKLVADYGSAEKWVVCGGGPAGYIDGSIAKYGENFAMKVCAMDVNGYSWGVLGNEETCNNGIDDDGDGNKDCSDSDCKSYVENGKVCFGYDEQITFAPSQPTFASQLWCGGDVKPGERLTTSQLSKRDTRKQLGSELLCIDGGKEGIYDDYWRECDTSSLLNAWGPWLSVAAQGEVISPFEGGSFLCLLDGWYRCDSFWGPEGGLDGMPLPAKDFTCQKNGQWIKTPTTKKGLKGGTKG